MNMKNILRLMGGLALTTGAATSVVACNQSEGVVLNADISKQLGLTNDKGEAVQEITLDESKTDSVMWTVPALTTKITADKLLTAENKAVNQACFDFINNVLKIKPTTGTKLDDAVFDKATLTAITGEVSKINPTLKKMDSGKDYTISGGSFNFQFKKGEEKVGDVYSINVKVDTTKGIIAAALALVVKKFEAAIDTDVVTNPNTLFVKDGPIPAGAKKGAKINILDTTDNGKKFASFNKITGLKITAQMESTDAVEKWEPDKTLIVSYKTPDVEFDKDIVRNEFKMAA